MPAHPLQWKILSGLKGEAPTHCTATLLTGSTPPAKDSTVQPVKAEQFTSELQQLGFRLLSTLNFPAEDGQEERRVETTSTGTSSPSSRRLLTLLNT